MAPTASDKELAGEIHDLRSDFHDFRVEIAEKLGAINANLEGFRGRVETSLGVAKWVAGIAAGIGVALVGWGYTQAQRAAHVEDAVSSLEKFVGKQSEQIARLIELREPRGHEQPGNRIPPDGNQGPRP